MGRRSEVFLQRVDRANIFVGNEARYGELKILLCEAPFDVLALSDFAEELSAIRERTGQVARVGHGSRRVGRFPAVDGPVPAHLCEFRSRKAGRIECAGPPYTTR